LQPFYELRWEAKNSDVEQNVGNARADIHDRIVRRGLMIGPIVLYRPHLGESRKEKVGLPSRDDGEHDNDDIWKPASRKESPLEV